MFCKPPRPSFPSCLGFFVVNANVLVSALRTASTPLCTPLPPPPPPHHFPMDYRSIITIEPGKRGGKPCIRGMRITVGDVLGWLAAGMSRDEIIADYPELTSDDITAALEYAAHVA